MHKITKKDRARNNGKTCAFARPPVQGEGVNYGGAKGMTLREYIATAAMQGMISRLDYILFNDIPNIASTAVEMADALLLALEENQP